MGNRLPLIAACLAVGLVLTGCAQRPEEDETERLNRYYEPVRSGGMLVSSLSIGETETELVLYVHNAMDDKQLSFYGENWGVAFEDGTGAKLLNRPNCYPEVLNPGEGGECHLKWATQVGKRLDYVVSNSEAGAMRTYY